jgi:hypothetical protein
MHKTILEIPEYKPILMEEKLMSFSPKQFRGLITDVLKGFAGLCGKPSLYSEDAVELLMLTAAQESHLGKYIHQIRGPALGVFQMEPATQRDIFDNYLSYHQDILDVYNTFIAAGIPWDVQMKGNLPLQIIATRLFYYRLPSALPSKDDVDAMAAYWKKYYNTYLGKGTVEEAVHNYKRFALK